MKRRPSYLSAVVALNRMGAIALPLGPEDPPHLHRRGLELARASYVIADPETAGYAQTVTREPVLVLGGGPERPPLPDGVTDMERIDLDAVPLSTEYEPNNREGQDLALLLVAGGVGDRARLARITNQRWAFSAMGGATLAELTPRDTVYCCTGLNHATGIMVSAGAALVGGARLALADWSTPEEFWDDVRRVGATVVFYSGEMGRELLNVPPSSTDRSHPVRLLCGSGMRADTWRRIQRRFGPIGVVETYGSTEGNAVFANVTGEKRGSIGTSMPGSVETALVRYDCHAGDFSRDERGRLVLCRTGERGVLVSRVDSGMPSTLFDGYTEARPEQERLVKGAFEPGDTWFNSSDVMQRDEDGEYWYVGRIVDMVETPAGFVSTRAIEDALCDVESVRMAAVWEDPNEPGQFVGALSLMKRRGLDLQELASCVASLGEHVRVNQLSVLDNLPVTGGFRPLKPVQPARLRRAWGHAVYDSVSGGFKWGQLR